MSLQQTWSLDRQTRTGMAEVWPPRITLTVWYMMRKPVLYNLSGLVCQSHACSHSLVGCWKALRCSHVVVVFQYFTMFGCWFLSILDCGVLVIGCFFCISRYGTLDLLINDFSHWVLGSWLHLNILV